MESLTFVRTFAQKNKWLFIFLKKENSTLREELITKEEQIIHLQESFNESDQQLKKQRRLLQVYEEKQKTLIANCKNLERQVFIFSFACIN